MQYNELERTEDTLTKVIVTQICSPMLPRRLLLHFYGHCVLYNGVSVQEALASLLTHIHAHTDIPIKLSKGFMLI